VLLRLLIFTFNYKEYIGFNNRVSILFINILYIIIIINYK